MEPQRSFGDLLDLTRRVAEGFDARERRPWIVETQLIELMKQVGDLSRHVMVAEGYYLPDRDKDPRYVTSREDIRTSLQIFSTP